MNVLQLISSRLGFYGAERVVVTLSAALHEIGVNPLVGVFHNTAGATHLEVLDQANLRGLRTDPIVCNGRLDWNAVQTIRDLVQRHDIDVIHCHGVKPVLYALFAACPGVGVVNTCHLWTFDSAEEWAISALERCILHAIDRVVLVSDQIQPNVRRFGLRADVIYNGIDMQPVLSPHSELREKMNWNDRLVVGAIGRLAPQKGLKYLLQAVPTVLEEFPKAIFVFAGDGPEREALEGQAKGLGIEDSIVFLGVRKDIPEILASIDVVAMPSVVEGLPMALLEAMASGKAVAATGVGAVPRVIQDRVNGILVSPGDVSGLSTALRDLLKSSEFRSTIGQRAQETVKSRFSAASMANQYLRVYRELACVKGRALSVV